MLYIVWTPIGNLEDMSFRAIRTLKEVELIACEDTRQTMKLLKHYNIENKLISFHAHSEDSKTNKIIDILLSWKSVALVSDAWTPWISDPAYELTSKARILWIKIIPIPWASAFLTALQASWIPINKFRYLWFLPAKKWRETILKSIQNNDETIIFYESVHRINKCLEQICKILWNNTRVIIARELTKIYEEFFDWKAIDALSHFWNPKWEFVVMIAPNDKKTTNCENDR